MLRKISLLISTISMILFLSSCEEDSSTAPNYTKLHPITINSNWSYDYYTLDKNNEHIESTHDVINVNVTEEKLHFNRLAYEFQKTSESSTYSDDYFYSENGKLYATTSYMIPNNLDTLPIPLDIIPAMWVVVADQNRKSWEIMDIPIKDFVHTVTSNNTKVDITINGNFIISGEDGGKSNLEVNSKTYKNTRLYNINYKFIGTAAATYMGQDLNVDLTLEFVMHQWFAPNIGLVKLTFDSYNETLLVYPISFDGFTRDLKDYSIAE